MNASYKFEQTGKSFRVTVTNEKGEIESTRRFKTYDAMQAYADKRHLDIDLGTFPSYVKGLPKFFHDL